MLAGFDTEVLIRPLLFCRQARKVTRKLIYKRAEKYHKEYRQMERREIRLARMARKVGNYYVPAEPKLAFVIRIRGWVCGDKGPDINWIYMDCYHKHSWY